MTYLEEVAEEAGRLGARVPGLVDLLEVVRLAEVGLPDLAEERLAEVKELILLKVALQVGVLGLEVVRRLPVCGIALKSAHEKPRPACRLTGIHDLLALADAADAELVEHVVRRVRVVVRLWVMHDRANVLARVLEHEVVPARVVRQEACHVVHAPVEADPARLRRPVPLDVLGRVHPHAFRHGHGWHERRTGCLADDGEVEGKGAWEVEPQRT
jgi:hypothetical protein